MVGKFVVRIFFFENFVQNLLFVIADHNRIAIFTILLKIRTKWLLDRKPHDRDVRLVYHSE